MHKHAMQCISNITTTAYLSFVKHSKTNVTPVWSRNATFALVLSSAGELF